MSKKLSVMNNDFKKFQDIIFFLFYNYSYDLFSESKYYLYFIDR